jgi:hypothetical protein
MGNPSPDAFREQFFMKHYPRIRYIVENTLLDKSLADAIIEMTVIDSFHRIEELQAAACPGAWLKNTAMMMVKRCNRNGGIACD